MIIKSKYLLLLGMLMMLSMVGCSNNAGSPEATDGDAGANTAMAKIAAYATDSTNNPAPTVADYKTAGVTGVDVANLSAVNAGIDATDAAGVDTIAKIQAIVNTGNTKADTAMDIIVAYATDSEKNPAPTVADYEAAGVD
jgi:hypothetical protein